MNLLDEISFFVDYVRLSLQGEIGMSNVDVLRIRRRIRTKKGPFADLTPTERELLRYRIGLKGGRPHTVGELSKRFGISPEEVLAIQEKALSLRPQPPSADSSSGVL
jgi:DNA-directed RNA polymerase sigma subunit (sigma70/sigma32)